MKARVRVLVLKIWYEGRDTIPNHVDDFKESM